ncbi:MAG TPA: 16S rRNA (guanine(527)-N(7))-methyltransferase RsmG [Bacteroidia bacterium]|nr:16S rRNA (guanine(527)-N(7))-methyltransferase RsmG [Bacteroidia bacterium]
MELISKYFPSVTPQQRQQLEQLLPLYEDWNSKINVISRKDIEQLYERHILHSLGIAKVTGFAPGTRILDVGTGGGFPGIPLAIMFPDCEFTLVDSIGKKIKVVQEVAAALGLKNVTAINTRAENVPGKFDFVVSRAVTRLSPFYGWIKGKIDAKNNNVFPNGVLYLKGGDLSDELNEFQAAYPKVLYKLWPLDTFFEEDFFDTKAVVQLWKV